MFKTIFSFTVTEVEEVPPDDNRAVHSESLLEDNSIKEDDEDEEEEEEEEDESRTLEILSIPAIDRSGETDELDDDCWPSVKSSNGIEEQVALFIPWTLSFSSYVIV